MIDNIDQDVDQGRMNEVNDLDGDEVSTADPVTIAGEVVTTAEDVKVTTAAATLKIYNDELTLAQTLIEIKSSKPKARGVIVQEPKPEKTLKKKDQIAFDEEVVRRPKAQMKAKMKEEERIAREKDEANIAVIKQWNEVQAKIDADMELAQKLQTEEQEQLTDVEKASYEKGEHICGYEYKDNIGKVKENSSKKLKRCLEIVHEDDDLTIEATPLSSKSPTIVNYKIYKEEKKSYFKIIKADENSQSYLTFGKMFKNFNIEDLEVLWSIVKERFKKTKPMDDMDNLLFQTLKTIFEHHAEDNI
nr:hypothetical protein [Tanacetum cinerariifolium]